jgi:DNA-binding XRE family transcriptional regulator
MDGMTATSNHSAATSFGRQMKKMRQARGWTLREMAATTSADYTTLSRIETGKRPPTQAVAEACDQVFPELRGWFLEFYDSARTWMPAGFRDWTEIENKAATLRVWSPVMIHGLLQTEEYARALLMVTPGAVGEVIAARLASRMDRQRRILRRDDPPPAWFVVDELSLYRRVGSAEVMAEQMRRLAEVASLPRVTMQILPAVEHPAGASELIVTDKAAYVEHMVSGAVFTDAETVSALAGAFHTIQAECFRASESLARIERMAEIWTGGNQATARATADRALKRPPATAR